MYYYLLVTGVHLPALRPQAASTGSQYVMVDLGTNQPSCNGAEQARALIAQGGAKRMNASNNMDFTKYN